MVSKSYLGKSKSPDGVEIEINPDAVTGGIIRQAQHLIYRRISSDVQVLVPKVSFAMRSMHCIQMIDLSC